MPVLAESIAMLDQVAPLELRGTVMEVRGLALHVADLPVPIGASVTVRSRRGGSSSIAGEVVGFHQDMTVVMPLGA